MREAGFPVKEHLRGIKKRNSKGGHFRNSPQSILILPDHRRCTTVSSGVSDGGVRGPALPSTVRCFKPAKQSFSCCSPFCVGLLMGEREGRPRCSEDLLSCPGGLQTLLPWKSEECLVHTHTHTHCSPVPASCDTLRVTLPISGPLPPLQAPQPTAIPAAQGGQSAPCPRGVGPGH